MSATNGLRGQEVQVTATALVWLIMSGGLLMTLSAIAAKVLIDFSRYELEVYCKRRNRPRRFDEILDESNVVAQAAETLQILAVTTTLVGSVSWLLLGKSEVAPIDVTASILCGTIVLLALTNWLPAAVVRWYSAPFLFHTWPLWRLFARAMVPLAVGAELLDSIVRRLTGRHDTEEDDEEAFEDEIRTIVNAGQRDGLLEADAREMIEGVIDLDDVEVSAIMTPRNKVEALDAELPWQDVLRFVVNSRRTRIPVYVDSLDHVIGILYVKDLLAELAEGSGYLQKPLRSLLRDARFVPDTQPVDQLLRGFLDTRSHMAIVKNEFRAVVGVVTMEDALEEIVGEIVDEADRDEEAEFSMLSDTVAVAVGRAHLDELNDELGFALPQPEDIDTIGGLVVAQLGTIPRAGQEIMVDHIRIKVLEASKRRVERVQLELITDEHPDNGAT